MAYRMTLDGFKVLDLTWRCRRVVEVIYAMHAACDREWAQEGNGQPQFREVAEDGVHLRCPTCNGRSFRTIGELEAQFPYEDDG